MKKQARLRVTTFFALLSTTTLAIGLFCLVATSAFATQLLGNEGFENGFDLWDTNGSYPGWEIQTTIAHTGVYAAKDTISNLGPNQEYYKYVQQTFTASPEQAYYASVYAKSNINPQAFAIAGLSIEFWGATGRLQENKSSIGGLTDWRQLYAVGTAPTGTTQVKLVLYVFASVAEAAQGGIAVGGVSYFDDAVFSTEPIPAPPAQTALINAGFENGLHDWSLIYPIVGPGFSVDDQDHSEGNYSAKSTIDLGAGQVLYSSAYQDLVYQHQGQSVPVYASAYIKTALNPSYGVAGLQFEFLDQDKVRIGDPVKIQPELQGTNLWTRRTLSATAPSNAVFVRLSVYTWTDNSSANGGTAHFDNVAFSYDPLPPEDHQINILNSGFENGLNNWLDLYGFPATISATAHSGNYSVLKTIGQIEGQSYYSQFYQDVFYDESGAAFPDGTPIYLTAYVKTDIDPISSALANIKIEFFNASGQITGGASATPITGQSDWRYLYAHGVTQGTVKVRISGFVSCPEADALLGGNTYFDDFVYSTTPLPLPAIQTAVVNGGFEEGMSPWFDLYGFSSTITTTQHYTGTHSAQKTIAELNPSAPYYSQIYQDIYYNENGDLFPTNMPVYAVGYVKTQISPLEKSRAGVQMEFFDASGNPITDQQGSPIVANDAVGGQTNWRYLAVGQAPPAGTAKVRVSGFISTRQQDAVLGGNGYFDDFRFSRNPVAFPVQATLFNANFENGLNDWDELYQQGEVTNDPIHSGQYAVYYTVDDSVLSEDFYGAASQEIYLKPRAVYPWWGNHPPTTPLPPMVRASVWVKTDIDPVATQTNAGLSMVFLDIHGSEISPEYRVTQTAMHDWIRISINQTAPRGTSFVRLACFLFGSQDDEAIGARAYFDDASLGISYGTVHTLPYEIRNADDFSTTRIEEAFPRIRP